MNLSTDVLGDLCRRIRTGKTQPMDADFLEWVFRDQEGWIRPEQGLPAEDERVDFIGGRDLDATHYISQGRAMTDGIHVLLSGLTVGKVPWGCVAAWRPAPALPSWLEQPVSEG